MLPSDIGRALIGVSDSTYPKFFSALRLPQRMAVRVEKQSPPGPGVFDFIFHLLVADRIITHDAEVSRPVTCSDLSRSHPREQAVLDALTHAHS